MKTARFWIMIAAAVLMLGALTGCGSKALVMEVYDDFRAKVQTGELDAAWAMLTDVSKRKFGDDDTTGKAAFRKQVEALKATAFAATAGVRNTRYDGGNENASSGDIHLFDEEGKAISKAGTFTAFNENGTWKVHWTLSLVGGNSAEIPGAGG